MKPRAGDAVEWTDVRIILSIARTGSFLGAAEALNISKATVTRRVQYLEQAAGTRLFLRNAHGTHITPAGTELLRSAGQIDVLIREFEQKLRALGTSEDRVITARMTEGVASYLITPVLHRQELGPLGIAAARTRQHLPPMKLLPMDSPEKADLSFVWTEVGESPRGLPIERCERLVDIGFVPFGSPRYRHSRRAPAKFDNLAAHKLVTMGAYRWFSSEGWQTWHDVLSRASADPIVVDWSQTVGFLVRGGAGIGLLPTYAPMYSDGLTRLELPVPPMNASLWLNWSEDALTDTQTRKCVSVFKRLFREADWSSPI
jgi:DNA-binding transcriptional LysR family regulator